MSLNRTVLLSCALLSGVATLATTGCAPAPPPAPEGLDDSARYMIREFYRDDAFFGAGVQGFMNWFNDEGYTLVGEAATAENTDSFTVNDLIQSDIEHLELNDLAATGGRDVTTAAGVVSLAEMDCDWKNSEALLMRSDQHVLFDETWENYGRTYQTNRAAFEEATQSEEFAEVDVDLDRFGAEFDPTPYETSILWTVNQVDPAPLLGVDVPEYEMFLDSRHGIYDVDGVPTPVVTILTFAVDETYSPNGENGLRQSYSIELNVARPDGKTLRMLAVWAEPISLLFDNADSPLALNYAVNKSLDASDRMTDVCTGAVEIPAED
ncbi:MAG: hypothetical protein KDA24_16065 [Deltaproteobacteria bacterium]|nr:hypothetical protein [Deltaproteobacteria bacterium]